MIEAAALERVVNFARAVGGDDDDRRLGRRHDADLRNRHLEVGQDLEQIGFEGLVGAVDLVDQQHRGPVDARLERLQERALDEIALREDVVLDAILVMLAGGLGEPDRHHLRGIVPFIDRARDVEALVALQADQLSAERGGENLGDLGLADAGFAFEEQRAPKPQAQEKNRRQRAVADVGSCSRATPEFRRSRPEGPAFARTRKTPRQRMRRRTLRKRGAAGSSPASTIVGSSFLSRLQAAATARFAITPMRCAR